MADRTIKKDTKFQHPITSSPEYNKIPPPFTVAWLPSYSNRMVYYQQNELEQNKEQQLNNQKLLLNQQEALLLTPTFPLSTPVISFRQSTESSSYPKLNKFSQLSDNSSNSSSSNTTGDDIDNQICLVKDSGGEIKILKYKNPHHCDSNYISCNKTNNNNLNYFCCYTIIESKDLIFTKNNLLKSLSLTLLSNRYNSNNINYIQCWPTTIPTEHKLQSTLVFERYKPDEKSLLKISSIFHLSKIAKNVMMSSSNDDNKYINKNIKINKNINSNNLDKINIKLNKFNKIKTSTTTTIQLILFMILLRLKFLLYRLTKWQRTRSKNNNNERIFKFNNKIYKKLSCNKIIVGVFYLIMFIMAGTCKAIGQDVPTNCTFPQKWEGSWFLSGYQQSIQIKGSQFSYRGKCTASDGNKYLIVDEKGCHRCLVIYEKHKNVLQYKESECEGDSMYMDQSMNPAAMPIRSIVNSDRGGGGVAHPNINGHSRLSSSDQYLMRSNDDKNDYFCKGRETLQTLCDQIPGDALLYSLFREQAEPVKCPLKGPFTFTYNRGHGECKSPVSNIDSCTEESRLLLSFQACPDVQGTESTVEELTCLAAWKDGNSRYLVGLVSHHHAISNEERFRCFVYEKISSMMATFPGSLSNYNLKDAEYKLAQSGDATCNGLDSAEVGSRIMTLRKPPIAERCDFPTWFKGPRHWHALMGNSGYQFHPSDGSMHITKPNGFMETRALCEQINKQTSNEMMAVVHYTTGCKSGFMCMIFYRRDTHVTELQTGTPASRLEDACAPDHFDIAKLPYITLLASNPESQICPLDGLYNLRGAIGPPYITSRHKRNHNTNYNNIKGHNQHNHHHHELQGHKRHETINNRNSDEFIHKPNIPTLNSHTKGNLNINRNRRDVIFNKYASSSSNNVNNNNNNNVEIIQTSRFHQQPNQYYSNLMRNSRKLAVRHTADNTNKFDDNFVTTNIIPANDNSVAAISVPFNEEASTKITITQSYNQIINETQRNRRDAPGCIVNYKAQRQLLVGCNEANQIDVRPMCSEDGDEVYFCHGSWTENGTTYIIAKHSGTQHGVCLSYRQLEGNTAKLIIGDACYRGYQKPPDHHLIANLTNFGKCGDSSSSKIIGTNINLTFTGIILIILMAQLS